MHSSPCFFIVLSDILVFFIPIFHHFQTNIIKSNEFLCFAEDLLLLFSTNGILSIGPTLCQNEFSQFQTYSLPNLDILRNRFET